MGMWSSLAFYPTLFYNVSRNYWNNTAWPWYSRVDELVILGALPFKSMLSEVWDCPQEDFEQLGISYYWLPTPDFVYAPDHRDIGHAVKFIDSFKDSGKSVYVHCKAGRSRSATVVACYLVQRHGYNVAAAMRAVYNARPHAHLRAAHWAALNDFAQGLGLP